MITTKENIISILENAGIPFKLFDHSAVFTADEASRYCNHVPGPHVKNLFLRDKKKTSYYLITLLDNKRVNINQLSKYLQHDRLSFGSTENLISMLGVQPGSITPIAIINDKDQRVKLFLDSDLQMTEFISIHPLENTATIHLKLVDLLFFLKNFYQREVSFMDIPVITEITYNFCPVP